MTSTMNDSNMNLRKIMDDLDCPPSSLPIASSGIDVEEKHTSNDPTVLVDDS